MSAPFVTTENLAFLGLAEDDFADVPQELKNKTRWVVWKEEKRNGKKTKVPYNALTGAGASSTDSCDWTTFEKAREVFLNSKGRHDGIGFVLGDGFCGFDFDACLHDNESDPYTASILNVLGSPYCEISPSGNGLKTIFVGELPPDHKKKFTNGEHSGIEVYSGGRYFTTTGAHFSGSKEITEVAPERAALAYFLASRVNDTQNQRFKELWLANESYFLREDKKWAGRSEAQLALVRELYKNGFNTSEKMVGAFRYSGLAYHDWERTIPNYDFPKVASGTKANEFSESGNSPSNESAAREKTQNGIVFALPAATGGTHKDWAFAPSPDMYEGWCPRGSISVIAGTSGVGKTRLIIPGLLAQRLHAPFLGHASAGYSFAIIGADRGEHDFYRTMESMRFPLNAFSFQRIPLTAFDLKAVQAICNSIEALTPMPEFIFIEGLDMMLSNVNDAHTVAMFIAGLQTIATYYHLSILGSVGSPKAKAGQDYNLTRDNIIGTGTWGRGVCTVFLMQYANTKDTKGKRVVTVAARGAKEEKFTLEFQDGMLIVVPNDPEPNEAEIKGRKLSKQVAEEMEWYQKMAQAGKTDSTKVWWTIQDMEQSLGRSSATARRHVNDAADKGFVIEKPGLKRRGGGSYQWNESASNPGWVEDSSEPLTL